jgi:hypothetical protein
MDFGLANERCRFEELRIWFQGGELVLRAEEDRNEARLEDDTRYVTPAKLGRDSQMQDKLRSSIIVPTLAFHSSAPFEIYPKMSLF